MNEYYHDDWKEKSCLIKKLQLNMPSSIIDLGHDNLYKKTKDIILTESQKNIHSRDNSFRGRLRSSGFIGNFEESSEAF